MKVIRRTRRYMCRNVVLLLIFVMFSAEMFYIHMNSSRITITDMDANVFCSKLRVSNGALSQQVRNEEATGVMNNTSKDGVAVASTPNVITTPNRIVDGFPVSRVIATDTKLTPGGGLNDRGLCRKIAGNDRNYKHFMSIGIPTVKRDGYSYLTQTIDSILENTSEGDRADVVVVVFLADMDYKFRADTVQLIATNYMPLIESGFIQVVEPPFAEYPNFDAGLAERNYNDTDARVRWRSKQVVDFAYMFSYCKDLSQYYLNLEDDVITKPNFVKSIRDFIIAQSAQKWVILEFSYLGFIGKLIRSEHLDQFSKFLMLFYSEKPVDFLLKHFAALHLQDKAIVLTPTLFQHIGEHSSLAGKIQNLKDTFFNPSAKQTAIVMHQPVYNGDNPPAHITTTLPHYMQYAPENSYAKTQFVFWSSRPGEAGDYFIIRFNESISLNKVVVDSGAPGHVNDSIHNGILYASQEIPPTEGAANQTASPSLMLQTIGTFQNGRVVADNLETTLRTPVQYLCITITKNQTEWVLIREIAVFTAKLKNIQPFV